MIVDLFHKGGSLMYLLLVLSIYVTAVILYKLHQFWKLKVGKSGFTKDIVRCLKDKDIQAAITIAKNHHNPLAKVTESALQCLADKRMSKTAKENEVSLSGTKALRQLESHLKGLELVANIAPLIGLLGTVTGMVKAFATLQSAGTQINPSLLAGGIWEALLTTVAGLSIAIPAVAAYYYIDGKVEKFRHTMEEVTTRILDMEETRAS